jgi:hypothetical protein
VWIFFNEKMRDLALRSSRRKMLNLAESRQKYTDGAKKLSLMLDSYVNARKDGPKPVYSIRWNRLFLVTLITLTPLLTLFYLLTRW